MSADRTTQITRVGRVIVPVSDQDQALEFYLAEADHAQLWAHGVDADAAVMRMGDRVPPMFTFRDPDGNRFRMVEGV